MSLPKRSHILPDRVPLSTEELDAFSHAFRETARTRGLTVQQACRYEAWALAFLSWCHEASSRRVEPERVDAFRTALRERAVVEDAAVNEAMDALAFLFGAARAALEPLSLETPYRENGDDGRGNRRSRSEKEILALQTSWEDGTDRSERNDAADPSSAEEADSEGGSTAEHCIRTFQTQLDAIHSSGADSE